MFAFFDHTHTHIWHLTVVKLLFCHSVTQMYFMKAPGRSTWSRGCGFSYQRSAVRTPKPVAAFCPWFWINCFWIVNIVHSFNHDKKTYPDAQETCEKAALNGFKTGRLVEPKTQSFNDKVYAATNKFFGHGKSCWIGIRARGRSWVYTSSGTVIVFKNWHNAHKYKKLRDCAYSIVNGKGKWATYICNSSFKISFICEFV